MPPIVSQTKHRALFFPRWNRTEGSASPWLWFSGRQHRAIVLPKTSRPSSRAASKTETCLLIQTRSGRSCIDAGNSVITGSPLARKVDAAHRLSLLEGCQLLACTSPRISLSALAPAECRRHRVRRWKCLGGIAQRHATKTESFRAGWQRTAAARGISYSVDSFPCPD